MKHVIGVLVLAGVMMAAGCSASPDNKAAESEIAVETPEATVAATATEQTSNEEEQPQATVSSDPVEQPTAELKKEETEVKETKESKQTNEVKKASEENKAVNKTVVDSILNKNENDTPAAKDDRAVRAGEIVAEMRSLAKDLKQQAEDKDTAQIKTSAGQMAEGWDSVKSDIQALAPEMYTFLDDKLTKLAELASSEEIDMEAILQLDYQIYQGFRQLSDHLNA